MIFCPCSEATKSTNPTAHGAPGMVPSAGRGHSRYSPGIGCALGLGDFRRAIGRPDDEELVGSNQSASDGLAFFHIIKMKTCKNSSPGKGHPSPLATMTPSLAERAVRVN